MVNDTILFKLIHNYFTLYLPKVRDCSQHTIRSYRSAMNSFLDFVKNKHKIGLGEITFNMLNDKILTEYLESLESSGNNESTRSLRLTCIKAFFFYAADVEPTAVIHEKSISKIKVKGGLREKIRMIDYLSETAIQALLNQPDPLTLKGVRDRFLMTLMYDTGARLAEIRGLRLCDIKNGGTTDVVVNGKGNKIRSIPLMPPTVEHMKHYMSVYHAGVKFGRDNYSHEPLFYVEQRGHRHHISDSAVRKIVREYGEMAKSACAEITDIVHPHLLRHSRAMHLYQHGMDLTEIQQWLGHAQLITTYNYAYADTEHKRKAIEKATPPDSVLRNKGSAARYTVSDETTLKKLYGLV